mmetsp:Transcript_28667/g.44029  ORF Transcript_28667/g.44029 Transcript_28667/m.44029 type:complete len:365 (-) Transcript_28667:50-1144(-)
MRYRHLSMKGFHAFVLVATLFVRGEGIWKTTTTTTTTTTAATSTTISMFVKSFSLNTLPSLHYNHRHSRIKNHHQHQQHQQDPEKISTTTNTKQTQLFLHNHQRHHHVDTMVTSIQSEKDLLDFLSYDEDDDGDSQRDVNNLRVVKVYATWCKTCRVFDLKFRKLVKSTTSSSNTNNHNNIRFGEIEFTANEALCRSLGATKFPYITIYKSCPSTSNLYESPLSEGSGGAITLTSALPLTEFRCGPSTFHRVVDAIGRYSYNNDRTLHEQNEERNEQHYLRSESTRESKSTTSDNTIFDQTMCDGGALVQRLVTSLEENQTNDAFAQTHAAKATQLSTTSPITNNGNPLPRSSFEDFCKSQSSS